VIVVDTSIWVAALRAGSGEEALHLRELLDADEVALPVAVRAEILSGARATDRIRLRRSLSALPVLYPNAVSWNLIDRWIDQAAEAGERFGFADLLIGALAAQSGAAVWSLDSDFARMARVGLLEIHKPAES
jgi:predicted nucleic acid-binding protein